MIIFHKVLEAVLITLALTTDCFVSGVAYGANKIKIPLFSGILINISCTVILAISILFGDFLNEFIPSKVTFLICVVILVLLGITKIFNSYIKTLYRNNILEKEVTFSLFSLKFILRICLDKKCADVDNSKILSAKEALALSLAFSLDGIAIGLGAGLDSMSFHAFLFLLIFSFLAGIIFLFSGSMIGEKIARKTSLNLTWLSGVMLIILALLKIFL